MLTSIGVLAEEKSISTGKVAPKPQNANGLATRGPQGWFPTSATKPRSSGNKPRESPVGWAHGIANQATTVMIRARAAITMIAHSVTQIANGTRFRCMFGQIKRGEVFCTTQRQRRAHPD